MRYARSCTTEPRLDGHGHPAREDISYPGNMGLRCPELQEAETAVRNVCGAKDVVLISGLVPLTSDVIRSLQLQDGQVRQRTLAAARRDL